MQLTVRVYGRPAPQGSHEIGANGQLLDSSRYLAKWRERVNFAVRRAYLDAGLGGADMPLFPRPAPVYVMITHYVMPEQCRAAGTDAPTGRPDFDKLLRATVDGLGDARAFSEDSQITDAVTGKTRAGEAGAEIIISDRKFWTVDIIREQGMEQGQYRLTLELVSVNEDGERSWQSVLEATDTAEGIVDAWLPTLSLRLGGGLAPATTPRVTDASSVIVTDGTPPTIVEAPKRKRRTKAEIAADEAAQAAGFRDAAHHAEMTTAAPIGAPLADAQLIAPDAPTAAQPADAPFNPFATP